MYNLYYCANYLYFPKINESSVYLISKWQMCQSCIIKLKWWFVPYNFKCTSHFVSHLPQALSLYIFLGPDRLEKKTSKFSIFYAGALESSFKSCNKVFENFCSSTGALKEPLVVVWDGSTANFWWALALVPMKV